MHKTLEIRHDATRWRAFIMVEWPATKTTKRTRTISLRAGKLFGNTVADFLKAFGPLELCRMALRNQELQNAPVDGYKGLLAAWQKKCQETGLVESVMAVGLD